MLPLPPPALMGSFYPRQCCPGLEILAKLATVQELEPADPLRQGAGAPVISAAIGFVTAPDSCYLLELPSQ